MSALLALLSSLLWGSADFVGGVVSRRLPAVAVVAWSQAAALIALVALAVGTSAWTDPAPWFGWAVLAGVVGALALICFYLALAGGTMGVVSPIASLGALVPLAAGILAGERPGALQWLGMIAALLGALGASGPELSGEVGRRAVLLAVLAGAGFGVALLAIARGAAANSLMTLTGMRATSVLGFVVLGLVLGTAGGIRLPDLPLLVVIGLADGGANLLYGIATHGELLTIVAVLGALYPVATVLLARYLLHERIRRVQAAGIVVALAGVALIAAG